MSLMLQLLLLSIGQRYILKANHNDNDEVVSKPRVVINRSKIHFESKSQRRSALLPSGESCYQ